MRSRKTLTVALGDQRRLVETRVASGAYASASDVVRAGLEALEREEAQLAATVDASIREALRDPRPAIPAGDVFQALDRKHAERAIRSRS